MRSGVTKPSFSVRTVRGGDSPKVDHDGNLFCSPSNIAARRGGLGLNENGAGREADAVYRR